MTSTPLGSWRLFDNPRVSLDSSVAYLTMCQALAADASVVVDVGCGRGALVDTPDRGRPLHDLRGPGRTVIGVDVDPAGAENPVIDSFRLLSDSRWPFDDASVDLVTADWVLEHIASPSSFVAEAARVIRPGGAFCARTVSRWSPLSAAARLVPNGRHAGVLGRLQPHRPEKDVFPTEYRMNTSRALGALLDADFEWSVAHRPGLDQYLLPWPAVARLAGAVEPRLPAALHTVLIVSARRKG